MSSNMRPSNGFELCDAANEIPMRKGAAPFDCCAGGGATRSHDSSTVASTVASTMKLAMRAGEAHRGNVYTRVSELKCGASDRIQTRSERAGPIARKTT